MYSNGGNSRTTKVVRKVSKVKLNAPSLNKTEIPYLVSHVELTRVHPVVKYFFSEKRILEVPLARRLKHFLSSWKTLAKDQNILSIVEGYKIPFNTVPHQEKVPGNIHMSPAHQSLDMEISEILKKGAISLVQNHQEKGFLSNLFLVGKKDGGHRPVINLKNLNKYIPYEHFKMEGLHYLKVMLQQGDYMCKLDLKDPYFSVPLHKDSKKMIRFQWSGNLYEFLCLCFGLGPAPRIFTKLLKIPCQY